MSEGLQEPSFEPGMLPAGHNVWAFLRVESEHGVDQIFALQADLVPRGRVRLVLLLFHLNQTLLSILFRDFERQVAIQHLEAHDCHCPDIGQKGIVRLVGQNFL